MDKSKKFINDNTRKMLCRFLGHEYRSTMIKKGNIAIVFKCERCGYIKRDKSSQ